MTLALINGNKVLCTTHFLTSADLSEKFDLIQFSLFEFCEYTIWKGKYLWLVTVTLNLGNGYQSFVRDTPSYFVLPFSEIWLNLLSSFWVIVETWFIRDERKTYDCDLDLGCGNLSFVLTTPSHYTLLLCDLWLNSLSLFWVIVDTQFVSDKFLTFEDDLDLGLENLNFVCDTPSHVTLPFLWSLIRFPLLVFELWLTHDFYVKNHRPSTVTLTLVTGT